MRGQVQIVDAATVIEAWGAAVGADLLDGDAEDAGASASLDALVRPERTALLLMEQDGDTSGLAVGDLLRAAARAGALVYRIRRGETYAAWAERDGDGVIVSVRDDAFEGSPLHALLRARQIRTVALAGTDAHRAVESTARGATHRNYHVVCIEDAIDAAAADVRDAALAIMRQRYDVMTVTGIVGLWRDAEARV
jgi:hypothetical protein